MPIQLSLRRKLGRFIRSLPGRTPFMISLYDLPEMRREIRRLSSQRRYDAFYYDHLHMAQYRPDPVEALHILDEHNIEAVLLERVYQNMSFRPEKAVAWLEWRRMQRYEPGICRAADYVITTTEVDARVLHNWGVAPNRIQVIPIGVDTDYFRPPADQAASRKNLTIIGTLGWPPNAEGVLWFYANVFSAVKQAVPNAHLTIIGDRSPESIRALSRDPDVSVLGYVDDVRPYLAESAALLVPLRTGSGMRVKILSGLAMGVPIISTPVGHEGIAVENGEHILSAAQPGDFARAAINLLERPELRQRLAAQGRDFVVRHYSWEKIYEMIETFGEKLCAGANKTPH